MSALRRGVLPLAFVVLYGSGFVGTRLGLPWAAPFPFLAWRFAIAALVLALLAFLLKAPWPRGRQLGDVLLAGLLTVGVFSVGVFYSLARGLPPAVSALVIALQPILVALGAHHFLGERMNWRRAAGLLLGLAGVALVVSSGWREAAAGEALALSVLALLGLAAGNLWQKARCASMNLFSGGALQCAACALLCLAGSLWVEAPPVRWHPDFIIALAWMALAVSVGALSLFYRMLRDGEASRVAGVFYLVPVATAAGAWLLFDQRVDGRQWLGAAIVAVGVRLATKA